MDARLEQELLFLSFSTLRKIHSMGNIRMPILLMETWFSSGFTGCYQPNY